MPFPVTEPLILIFALLLDWLIGDMRWFFKHVPHPVVLIGKLISFFERKLNRTDRSSVNLSVRGAVVTFVTVGLSALVGYGFHQVFQLYAYGWVAEIILVAILLAQRSLAAHVATIGKALKNKDEGAARDELRHIVSRDPKKLDVHGVARSALESLAENFSDAVVAPAHWYILLGLPGLCAYKAVNTLDSMIGYRTKRYEWFGMIAAKLDDAVNWPAARLSGLIFVIGACFAPEGNPVAAFKVMMRDASKHASPNAGWPEGAMAGAFDMALGGPRSYPGGLSETVWIGDGRARLVGRDVMRGVTLFAIGCGILWLVALILYLVDLRSL